jgi:hypothetical protein
MVVDTNACVEVCPINHYLNSQNQKCELCHENCSVCTFSANGFCSACRVGKAFNQATAECLDSCGVNQYSAPIGSHPLACLECSDQNCETCSFVNSQVDCYTCLSTFYLRTTDNKCISQASCLTPLVIIESP